MLHMGVRHKCIYFPPKKCVNIRHKPLVPCLVSFGGCLLRLAIFLRKNGVPRGIASECPTRCPTHTMPPRTRGLRSNVCGTGAAGRSVCFRPGAGTGLLCAVSAVARFLRSGCEGPAAMDALGPSQSHVPLSSRGRGLHPPPRSSRRRGRAGLRSWNKV